MGRIVYLDQNAWVALAKGSWDKNEFPREHLALTKLVEQVQSHGTIVPLSLANIYETSKINDPVRRANMARAQALISGGRVFRGRRRILGETLAAHLALRSSIARPPPPALWFISDLWFESAGDYSPESYGFEIPRQMTELIRANPGRALFDYLAVGDEAVRIEAVRRSTAGSDVLIASIEARRAIIAGKPMAMRKRAYGARLVIDELDFIIETGRRLGLEWRSARDIGSSLARSIPVDVPILNVERELVVRLEDRARPVNENDLRDMMSFMTVVPLADVVVAEKPFVNMARQARLGEAYATTLMTSVLDL